MTTPAVMTYDSLVTDIGLYCERDEDTVFTAQIPRFIMLAENRLASEVRGLGFLKVVDSTMSIGNPVIAKPSRWRETATFHVTVSAAKVMVYERSYEYCSVYTPDTTTTGVPRFYSDYDYEHFYVVPSPTIAYPFKLRYYERPEPLSSINETNWTTQYAPQLILYAALMEANIFLKNPQMVEMWKGLYMEAMQAITAEAKRRAFDRSTGIRE